DLQVLLDQRDEWQKQLAVETILVKLPRRNIRRGDHHDVQIEQALEQAPENHGISDVGNVEFIEAQQPSLLRNGSRGERDGILTVARRFASLPHPVDAFVHLRHEFMEVDAAFARDRRGLKEHVHQHGLAASDVAENVESLDRLARAHAEAKEPTQCGPFACRPALRELGFEARQAADHCLLLGVAFDYSSGDSPCVERGGGNKHKGERTRKSGERGATQPNSRPRVIGTSVAARPQKRPRISEASCCAAASWFRNEAPCKGYSMAAMSL